MGVYKWPNTMQGDHSKRNENKYCRYYQDVGHTIEECIALKDEIEKLIREGYLQNYVRNGGTKPREDQHEAGHPHEIRTTFGGPHFAEEMRGSQNRYLREAREGPVPTTSYLDQRPAKQVKGEADTVTFSEKNARHVRHPHYDALGIKAMVANTNIHRILVGQQ